MCVNVLYLHITESLLELSNFLLSLSYLPLPLVLAKRNNTLYTHQFEPASEPAKLIIIQSLEHLIQATE